MTEFAIRQADLQKWRDADVKSDELAATLKELREKFLAGDNRHNVEPGDLMLMITVDKGSSVAYKKAIDDLIPSLNDELKAKVKELVAAHTKPSPKTTIQVDAKASAGSN